ncbi:Protein krasavietz [Eumeta japonica]|uniref:Protein krasavietz n=1 Tax=Eumeta variegata TaxID=151549 RepID=A0A4C1TDT7_EUMVA|nr:Protein krasavietz [Eumeta japonica]
MEALGINEKEKYDPNGFRDALVAGLERAAGDLDAAYKFLDSAGSKLDYRRYGEVIFDVLIAGGLFGLFDTAVVCTVPGGSVSLDGDTPRTTTCIFAADEDMDTMRSFEQVFVKLMRRYKYLEKMFEEEMKKVSYDFVLASECTPLEPPGRSVRRPVSTCATATRPTRRRGGAGPPAAAAGPVHTLIGICIRLELRSVSVSANGCVPPNVLLVLINEHLLKDNLALDFVLEVFSTFKQERGFAPLITALKKGQLEGRHVGGGHSEAVCTGSRAHLVARVMIAATSAIIQCGRVRRLLEFLPLNRRNEEALTAAFSERGLSELIKLHRAQASQEARRDLTRALEDDLADEKPIRDVIADLRELAQRTDVPDHEVVAIVRAARRAPPVGGECFVPAALARSRAAPVSNGSLTPGAVPAAPLSCECGRML